jgi:hypothetical protein
MKEVWMADTIRIEKRGTGRIERDVYPACQDGCGA